ncbi:MAG: beta strand repeat-containing protein, partial [Deltaproteobacteria bacterium]
TTAAVTADCSVIANFARDAVVTHKVTPSVGTDPAWGTISPDTQQTVNDGATTQFTLSATGGYHIDTVGGTCGGTLDGGTGVFTTAAVTADCSVVANFAQDAVVACTTGSPVEVKASLGTPGPSGYPALKDAFDAVNAGTHQGAISVSVCGDTSETASATLNASGSGAAAYTAITVRPDGGAARTVSGAITAGSALINLNGADNVTIDGLNSGGNALTLSNTTASGTAGTSTIRFIEGATNNTVTNTTILGSATGATTVATGTVLFSTSTVAGGNSNNTVSNNDIGPAGTNLPAKAVQGLGSSGNANAGNIVSGNKIHDFFAAGASNAGISVYNFNTGWTMANNRIYQTAARTFTNSALRYTGILIDASSAANGGNAFQITGNVIGFGAANGTGTTTISGSSNEFRGILLNGSGTTTASTVQGNTISGINQSSSRASTTSTSSIFIGIEGGGPSIDAPVDILNNTVGSLDGSSTIVINASSTAANTAPAIAIYDFNATTGLEVSGNNIGAITLNQNGGVGTLTGFRGILSATGTTISRTISNNTIGGPTAAGGIVNNLTGGVIYGIQVGSTTIDATGNLVQNITNNCTTSGTVAVAGLITTASTGANVISQNTIRSLVNNAGTNNNSIYALYTSFANNSGSVVERNFVHSLMVNSTALTSQIAGILPVAGSGTYQNNMVRLGYDAAGNAITSGIVMYGMFEIAGTNNVYNNSVYVGGSGVASSSNTFAFVSNVTTGTRNYVDNIFWNARSNASGSASNVAGALSAATGATSDYNDLYANGTGGVAGAMATGLDVNSVSVDPLFVAPTGTMSTVDLHVQSGSPVIGAGTPIAGVTGDFDGDARSAAAPAIGADEGTPSGGGAAGAHVSPLPGQAVSAAALNIAAPAVPEAIAIGRSQ